MGGRVEPQPPQNRRPALTKAKCQRAIDAIVALIETGRATRAGELADLDRAADVIRSMSDRADR